MTQKNTPNTDYIVVRHSRTEMRTSIEKADKFDLTNYTFLRMSDTTSHPMEEWVWTEDVEMWKGVYSK